MANLKEWVRDKIGEEDIEGIVIGDFGWQNEKNLVKEELRNKVLSWEEAAPLIDYNFDSGYGSVGCHTITVWTKTKVIFVGQYDGSTNMYSVPRNPIDHSPIMPGG